MLFLRCLVTVWAFCLAQGATLKVDWTVQGVQNYTNESNPLRTNLADTLELNCQGFSNLFIQTDRSQYDSCNASAGSGVFAFNGFCFNGSTLTLTLTENSQDLMNTVNFENNQIYYFTSYSRGVAAGSNNQTVNYGGQCSDGLKMVVLIGELITHSPSATDGISPSDTSPSNRIFIIIGGSVGGAVVVIIAMIVAIVACCCCMKKVKDHQKVAEENNPIKSSSKSSPDSELKPAHDKKSKPALDKKSKSSADGEPKLTHDKKSNPDPVNGSRLGRENGGRKSGPNSDEAGAANGVARPAQKPKRPAPGLPPDAQQNRRNPPARGSSGPSVTGTTTTSRMPRSVAHADDPKKNTIASKDDSSATKSSNTATAHPKKNGPPKDASRTGTSAVSVNDSRSSKGSVNGLSKHGSGPLSGKTEPSSNSTGLSRNGTECKNGVTPSSNSTGLSRNGTERKNGVTPSSNSTGLSRNGTERKNGVTPSSNSTGLSRNGTERKNGVTSSSNSTGLSRKGTDRKNGVTPSSNSTGLPRNGTERKNGVTPASNSTENGITSQSKKGGGPSSGTDCGQRKTGDGTSSSAASQHKTLTNGTQHGVVSVSFRKVEDNIKIE